MASYSKEKNKSYMPQLDILRSVAITAIILFHAKKLDCGYLGVDVFFVISGFLFLYSVKSQANSFRPFEFAKKRIGRILPSMMAVCFFTLVLTIVLTSSGYTLATARQAFSDLLFYGNIYQDIAGGGYMDTNPFANPLMHLWYLQVLIQITVVLIFLELLKRYSRKCYVVVFSALFVGSFLVFFHFRYEMFVNAWLPALTGYLRRFDLALSSVFGRYLFYTQDSGYLWTLGRYWMFMSGMLCYRCYVGTTMVKWCVLAWLLGILTFFTTARFDGLTVAATGSVIFAGQMSEIRRIADWPLFKCVGKYSFVLYLIHWPVLSLTHTVLPDYLCEYRGIFMLCTLILTPPLSYLLHCAITNRRIGERKIIFGWLGLVLLSYSICLYPDNLRWKENTRTKATVWDAYLKFKPVPPEHSMMKDFPELLNFAEGGKYSQQLLTSYFFFDFSQPYGHSLYFVGDESCDKPTCILLGDSNIHMFKEALHEFLQQHKKAGILLCSYVCPFDNSIRTGTEMVRWDQEKYEALFAWLNRHPEIKTIYINQSWIWQVNQMKLDWNFNSINNQTTFEYIYDHFGIFARKLRSMNKKVYVFTPIPFIPHYSDAFYKKLDKARLSRNMRNVHIPKILFDDYLEQTKPSREALNELEKEGVISLLHIENSLFKEGIFVPFDENEDYMNDEYHLSPTGTRKALQGCENKLIESIRE